MKGKRCLFPRDRERRKKKVSNVCRGRLNSSCTCPSLEMPVGLVEQLVLHKAARSLQKYFHWKSQEQILLTHCFLFLFTQEVRVVKPVHSITQLYRLPEKLCTPPACIFFSLTTTPNMTFILLLHQCFASVYKLTDNKLLSCQRDHSSDFVFCFYQLNSAQKLSSPGLILHLMNFINSRSGKFTTGCSHVVKGKFNTGKKNNRLHDAAFKESSYYTTRFPKRAPLGVFA